MSSSKGDVVLCPWFDSVRVHPIETGLEPVYSMQSKCREQGNLSEIDHSDFLHKKASFHNENRVA